MKKTFFIGAVFLSLIFLVSCAGSGSAGQGMDGNKRTGTGSRSYQARMPEPGTTNITESKGVKIDVSNANLGYAIITCNTGSSKRLKAQIQSGEIKHDYDINSAGQPEVFPLAAGDGSYKVSVLENIDASRYTPIASTQVNVSLTDPHNPFLVPNQFVNYTKNSQAVAFGYELTKDCGSDIEVVDAVYEWMLKHIKYDYEKAATVQTGYLPNVDATLSEKKGICFDYAALAAAILRSHDIPTKLITGRVEVSNAPDIEAHAWNMIYVQEQGWIARSIQFDGQNYQLVDTTLDAGGNQETVTYYQRYEY